MEEDSQDTFLDLENGTFDMAGAEGATQPKDDMGKERMRYNRVVLHDFKPTGSTARIFVVSVKKSGFDQAQVDKMSMTRAKRVKARLLHIYQPPRYFNLLCKVEAACTNKETMAAVNVLSGAMAAILKSGKSVEDAVDDVVKEFPGHVQHGVAYQAKGLPEKRTIRRFDRAALVVSESDAAAAYTTDGEKRNELVSKFLFLGDLHTALHTIHSTQRPTNGKGLRNPIVSAPTEMGHASPPRSPTPSPPPTPPFGIHGSQAGKKGRQEEDVYQFSDDDKDGANWSDDSESQANTQDCSLIPSSVRGAEASTTPRIGLMPPKVRCHGCHNIVIQSNMQVSFKAPPASSRATMTPAPTNATKKTAKKTSIANAFNQHGEDEDDEDGGKKQRNIQVATNGAIPKRPQPVATSSEDFAKLNSRLDKTDAKVGT